MQVPQGMTETQVRQTIHNIAERFKYKYRFGSFTEDDIYQEAWIIAMEGLEKYDGERPLENFLAVHVSNRLKNFKRDNFYRQEPKNVPVTSPEYQDWYNRYGRKKNLIEPLDLGSVKDEMEARMQFSHDYVGEVDGGNIMDIIDQSLDLYMRQDYLRMLDGVTIPTNRKEKLVEKIKEILAERGYDQETWANI